MRNGNRSRYFYALALCWLTAAAAPATDFEIVVIEPLVTAAAGTFEILEPADMNNRGEVTGRACRSVSCRPSAAFRYSPVSGVEDVGPAEATNALGERINESGQVFGRVVDNGLRKFGMFLWDEEAGLDPLEGLSRRDRNFFILGDLSDDGIVAGGIFPFSGRDRTIPVIHVPGEGWTDLTSLHPSYAEDGANVWQVNERGDLILRTAGPPPPGEVYARQESWFSRGGRTPRKLAHLGKNTNVPGTLTDRGAMEGLSIDAAGHEVAYYYSRSTGVVPMLGARHSSSLGPLPVNPTHGRSAYTINAEGATSGVAKRRNQRYYDVLFTFRPGEGLRVVRRPRAFRRHMQARGLEFRGVTTVGLSDRREQAGRIQAKNIDRSRFFFFSPDSGLHDIQELFDAAGIDARVTDVHEINAAGQVLLTVAPEGRRRAKTAAVLTPSVE